MPPLSTKRHWHSFHNAWSTYLAENLNQILPAGYFAEPNVQFGIEIDGTTWSEAALRSAAPAIAASSQWMPQSPTATLPFQPTTDSVEVQIFSTQAGPTLVGAIELVSPANKDRPSHRTAFVSKCQTYLQQGLGRVIVDIVTTLSANLHNEALVRGRNINLPSDPPPDLVIESDYTNSSVNKQALYAALGVPELWQYTRKTLLVYLRIEGGYELSNVSLAFPFLPIAEVADFIEQSRKIGQRSTVRMFRQRIRAALDQD